VHRSSLTSGASSTSASGFPGPQIALGQVFDVTFVRPSSGWGLADEQGSTHQDVVVHSTDGGRTWHVFGPALPPIGGVPDIAASSLEVLLAGNGVGSNVADAVISASGSASVLVSTDRLRSWRRVSFPAPVLAVAGAPGPDWPGAPASLATGITDQPLWVLVGPWPATAAATQAHLIVRPGALVVLQLYPGDAAWKPYGQLAGPSWTGHSAVAFAQLDRLSTDDGYAIVDGDVADPSSPAGAVSVSLLQRTTTDAAAWQPVSEPCGTHNLRTPLSAVSLEDLWLGCAGEPGAGNQMKTLDRSTDGGTQWTTAWSGVVPGSGATPKAGVGSAPGNDALTPGYLNAVVAISATSAYIGLGRGGLLYSSDAGAHWETVLPHIDGSGGVAELDVLDGADAWALVNRSLWATTDGQSSLPVWAPLAPDSPAPTAFGHRGP